MSVKQPRPGFSFRLRTVLLLFVIVAPFLKLGHNVFKAYHEREAAKATGTASAKSTASTSSSQSPAAAPSKHALQP
jgi:hypothetical protein